MSGTTSGKLRIRAVAQRMARGESGVTLVEMMVSLFIFAIVCEELGLIGATVIMLLFAALILRGFWIALHARDRFGSLMVVGVMTLVGLQTFLNIGVVTGLLPTTGISLPFFSYGGTALSIQLAEMGIVLSVSRQMKPTKAG